MANIYDTINQLEREVRAHEDYQGLKNAMEAVVKDEEAFALYNKFRQLQVDVQTKMQLGNEISQEEIKEAQDLEKEMGANETISKLLQAEKQLNQLVEEINKVVTEPIYEVYQKANEQKGDQA
ncbi:YlbF family regulator [Aerococcus sanguinicola]|uniref:YlbF family regulator n=1 Tax=unclassified Aerococcus TaxID=2618060 RepID=UPI0008A29319|nr:MULTISPECIES: YlbF family regulator [unclassified Aerococcus]KAB0645901.1 YlbF family regulator [Aerococcus sanguinicola]MDK6234196.1 YlbF family regulator [Aerococcus sp. UMB10185]MDK6805040.1 YlbF family regulator [Aerococcus sp. UMB7834]MDK6856212.1 YlbF family regulator [Aerococcus sp. UMB7533]MDK8503014.1 YlbF family regulator [Aerococcus sp. UMB1112A]